MHKLEQIDYIVSSAHIACMPFILLFYFGKLKIILRNSGWSAKNKFQLIFNRFWLFFTVDKIFPAQQPGVQIFVAVKAPESTSDSFPQLCASTPTKNTITSFPYTGFFLFWSWKKFNFKPEKIFNTIISQWSCWMQPIKKQNKHCQTSLWENQNVE